jgi:anti-sigma regulatory factor (Ser/Thr protein kinase)
VEFSTKVELLLEEHLVNIIEHGMKETKNQNDFIMLRMDCQESRLILKVWDRGGEWKSKILENGGPTPDGVLDILNSRHSESGRGVLIMRKIAPKITHERHCGLNETTFYIPYGSDSQGEEAKQEQ